MEIAQVTPPPGGIDPDGFVLGDWQVEPGLGRLTHAASGAIERLEPKVMEVLVHLARHQGELVGREQLEHDVWRGALVGYDAVSAAVIKLRKALGDNARSPRFIETIPKKGYRLIVPCAPLGAPGACQPAGDEVPAPVAKPAPSLAVPARQLWPGLLATAIVLAVSLWWLSSRTAEEHSQEPVSVASAAVRSVVAVLPFENLGGDPGQNYFADGITEDLITDLSKLAGLRVVARNSVLPYRASAESDDRIGAALGARYLVRGSVRRDRGRVRINVSLSDAQGGFNRWAERYDGKLDDIFLLQDQITAHVVSALQIELAPADAQRLTREYATSIDAYDAFLRGLELLGHRSGSANVEAKGFFEQAIAIEPRFARAYAGLAQAYSQDAVYDRGPRVMSSLARAEEIARKGMAIDDSLPQLWFVTGMVEMFRGNLKEAAEQTRRAIELKPSYADGYGLLARILHFAGRPWEGLEAMDQAYTLNPRVPAIYRTVKGALYYQLGDLERALTELERSEAISPNVVLTRLYLAAVYAAQGRAEDAGWQIDELLAINPGFTLGYLDDGFPMRDPDLRQRLLSDLRMAGMPEEPIGH